MNKFVHGAIVNKRLLAPGRVRVLRRNDDRINVTITRLATLLSLNNRIKSAGTRRDNQTTISAPLFPFVRRKARADSRQNRSMDRVSSAKICLVCVCECVWECVRESV